MACPPVDIRAKGMSDTQITRHPSVITFQGHVQTRQFTIAPQPNIMTLAHRTRVRFPGHSIEESTPACDWIIDRITYSSSQVCGRDSGMWYLWIEKSIARDLGRSLLERCSFFSGTVCMQHEEGPGFGLFMACRYVPISVTGV